MGENGNFFKKVTTSDYWFDDDLFISIIS